MAVENKEDACPSLGPGQCWATVFSSRFSVKARQGKEGSEKRLRISFINSINKLYIWETLD